MLDKEVERIKRKKLEEMMRREHSAPQNAAAKPAGRPIDLSDADFHQVEKEHPRSVELSRTAILSALFSVIEFTVYTFTWPALPPIIMVPFITSFFLALTMPFSKSQWAMGLIASVITIVARGAVLPGPFVIPVYGLVFQSRRVKLSGMVSSVFHVLYCLFLAPLIFVVAPGKVIYQWLLAHLGSYAPAVAVAVVVFGVGGVLAASAGRTMGTRLAKVVRGRGYRVYDR